MVRKEFFLRVYFLGGVFLSWEQNCREGTEISHMTSAPTHARPPLLLTPPIGYHWYAYTDTSYSFTVHHMHYSSALVVLFVGLDKCIVTCIPHCIIMEYLHCPKYPQRSTLLFLHQSPGHHSFFYCFCYFAFSRILYSWDHIVCTLFRLVLSVNNLYLRFPPPGLLMAWQIICLYIIISHCLHIL